MTSSLFVFGRTPTLSFRELQTFFPQAHLVTDAIALSHVPESFDPSAFIEILGGTVKIVRFEKKISSFDLRDIYDLFPDNVAHITFGMSCYGKPIPESMRSLLANLKNYLESKGIKSRFIEARQDNALSSVVVAKNKVLDIVIVGTEHEYLLGVTEAVQPFESWSMRDYNRPHRDPKSGMLPPKVARMLVNIAQKTDDLTINAKKTLCDPFCGMGTILQEGLVRGWRVVGSDIDSDVTKQAFENLTWIVRHEPGVTGRIENIFVSEAVHLSSKLSPNSLDAIVTEPFMGSTKLAVNTHISTMSIQNTIKGLEKLYIGCLRDWHPLLRKNGMIIIALPKYVINDRTYFVKKVVDMCENLGYTIETEPIEYSREQAVVRREFYLLRKFN